MSFSATVKDELCRLELGKNCCMLSELAALYRTSGSLTFHGGGRVQVQYRVENTGAGAAGFSAADRAHGDYAAPALRPARAIGRTAHLRADHRR